MQGRMRGHPWNGPTNAGSGRDRRVLYVKIYAYSVNVKRPSRPSESAERYPG